MRAYLAVRLSEDVRADDLVVVHANLEVKVGEQVRARVLELAQDEILAGDLANVAPHRQVLHEHLKVVVVVHSLLELLDLLGGQVHLAQLAPGHLVPERDVVRRSLLAVACHEKRCEQRAIHTHGVNKGPSTHTV